MYGIMRVQKVKADAVGALEYHNDRHRGGHSNPNIDPERTGLNQELVPHGRYADEVDARIAARRESTRAVRKDAVVLVEGIATASPEFFVGKPAAEVARYFNDVYEFCRREFGDENIVHFTIHMDESTPHAHFGFTPIKDGKLSWKQFFPDKYSLGKLQDRYFDEVGKAWGLERGEKGTGVKHRDLETLRRVSQREVKELGDAIAGKETELEAVSAELAEEQQRLESVRREIAEKQLQPLACTVSESARALAGDREAREREESLRSEVEGLRSRLRASERAIEGKREQLRSCEAAIERAREGLADLRRRLTAAMRKMGAVPRTLSRAALDLAAQLGKETYDPRYYGCVQPSQRPSRGGHRAL